MIIELLICFSVAAGISFVGSVQFGPVNLRVIQAACDYNMRSALVVAAGGILPEIIYSSIAIWCSWLLINNSLLIDIIRLIAILFFLISGIFMILKSPREIKKQVVPGHTYFASGFIAGILNPMLYAFWFMIINLLAANNVITLDTSATRIAFVLGTATGAFLLLACFSWLAQRYRKVLERSLMGKVNKLIGVIFIILAVHQFINLLP